MLGALAGALLLRRSPRALSLTYGLTALCLTLFGGDRAAGTAREIWLHVGLWLGFALGAALGAFAAHRWSSWAVVLPVVTLLVVAARTALDPPSRPADL